MKKLIKATSYLTLANLSEMVCRFGRTKAIAVLLGPNGTGFLAQIGFFVELLRVSAAFGTRRAVTKQIGEIRGEGGIGSPRYATVITSALALQLFLSLAVAAAGSVFSREISFALFRDDMHAGSVTFACWILPLASLSNLFGTILRSHLAFKSYAGWTIVSNALTLLIAPFLVWKFGVTGGIAGFYFFYGFPVLVCGYACFRKKYLPVGKVDPRALREMFADGFNNFYQLVASNLVRVIIASWVTAELGMETMGIYQVVLTLTTVYLTIPIQSIGGYTLPLIAAAQTNEEIGRAVNDSFRLLLLVLVPVIVFIVIVPRLVIDLLYSAAFFDAVPALRWQLVGTLFEVVNFSLGTVLAAKGRYKFLYVTATIHTSIYLGLSWLLFFRHELIGLAWAFIAANAAMSVILIAFNRSQFGIVLDKRNWVLTASMIVWVGLAYAAADAGHGKRWIEAAALFSGAFFMWISLTAEEKVYLTARAARPFKALGRSR